jgi:hypothetical protein
VSTHEEYVVTTLIPVEGQCDDFPGGELAGDIVNGKSWPRLRLRMKLPAVAGSATGIVGATVEFDDDAMGLPYLSQPGRGR